MSMLNRLVRYSLVGVFALAVAGYGNNAFAQDDDDGGGDEPAGDDAGGEPAGDDTGGTEPTGDDTGGGTEPAPAADAAAHSMILPKGKIAVAVGIDVSLMESAIAKPLSIRPDVWYGVMPKLEVGVAHSAYGLAGWWGGLGGGICVSGTDGGCGKAYNGPVGVIAHYLLMEGNINLAADAGVVIQSIDPMALGVKLGVMGNKMMGKLMIGFNPNIKVGLTERDAGNKEVLSVPVSVMFAATPKVHAGLQTGITGPLDGFGDAFAVPVSLGAMFMATPNIMAGASFNLFRVAGFEGPGAADIRGISIFAMWHN
jgi:hypothetical protein